MYFFFSPPARYSPSGTLDGAYSPASPLLNSPSPPSSAPRSTTTTNQLNHLPVPPRIALWRNESTPAAATNAIRRQKSRPESSVTLSPGDFASGKSFTHLVLFFILLTVRTNSEKRGTEQPCFVKVQQNLENMR